MQDLSCYPSVVAPSDGGHPPPFPLGGSFSAGNFWRLPLWFAVVFRARRDVVLVVS